MMNSTSSAYSRGSPRRLGNGTEAPSESCAACGSARSIGVPKMPGAIAMTRMPNCDSSRATGRSAPRRRPSRPRRPPGRSGLRRRRPTRSRRSRRARRRRAASRFCMSAAASRIMLKVPVRLTAMTFSNSASGIGPSRPTMRLAGPMPAQLIRMRAGPCLSRASLSAASALSELVTSQRMAMPPIFPATALAPSRLMSRQATLAPAWASCGRGLGAEAGGASGDDGGVSFGIHALCPFGRWRSRCADGVPA